MPTLRMVMIPAEQEPVIAEAGRSAEDNMIPSQADFGDLMSLDVKTAWDHFGGKTSENAELLFRQNSLFYQEDLMWMGTVAFQFYFVSVVQYVKSTHSRGDADIVSCLAGTLDFRREFYPESLKGISGTIVSLCDYVIAHYADFNISEEIYGNLKSRYLAIRKEAEPCGPANHLQR